jgi:hypothetical protein
VHALPSLQPVPLVAAAQAPVVIEQVLQTPHADPLFCQAPFESHCCGWLPLHVFDPGVQDPVHWPLAALQTYRQADPLFCQVPFASQSCG